MMENIWETFIHHYDVVKHAGVIEEENLSPVGLAILKPEGGPSVESEEKFIHCIINEEADSLLELYEKVFDKLDEFLTTTKHGFIFVRRQPEFIKHSDFDTDKTIYRFIARFSAYTKSE